MTQTFEIKLQFFDQIYLNVIFVPLGVYTVIH